MKTLVFLALAVSCRAQSFDLRASQLAYGLPDKEIEGKICPGGLLVKNAKIQIISKLEPPEPTHYLNPPLAFYYQYKVPFTVAADNSTYVATVVIVVPVESPPPVSFVRKDRCLQAYSKKAFLKYF